MLLSDNKSFCVRKSLIIPASDAASVDAHNLCSLARTMAAARAWSVGTTIAFGVMVNEGFIGADLATRGSESDRRTGALCVRPLAYTSLGRFLRLPSPAVDKEVVFSDSRCGNRRCVGRVRALAGQLVPSSLLAASGDGMLDDLAAQLGLHTFRRVPDGHLLVEDGDGTVLDVHAPALRGVVLAQWPQR